VVAPVTDSSRSAPSGTPLRFLIAAGVAETLLLGTLAWWPGAAFPNVALALFGSAFAVYAVTSFRVGDTPGGYLWIWFFAVLMRLVLLPQDPSISDDIFRYLWDGDVQRAGINPYLYPPAAEELAHVRTGYHALINNPTISTIYGPFAQMAFWAISMAGGTLLQAKLLWVGCDLATGWVIDRIALATGRSRRKALVLYLWSPLLIVEVAWSGHLEPLGILAMMLAVFLARKPLLAGLALACAVATKFAPIVALPVLARRWGWRAVAGFTITLLLLYARYLSAGAGLFAGLSTYAEHWWFMKGPFVLLEAVFPDPIVARRAAAAVVAGVVVWGILRRVSAETALFFVLGTGMIFTPTLHPWYVLWMLPFAALRSSRPWILMTGLVFLGYYGLASYQASGDWLQPRWLRAAMWLPFLGWLVYDAWKGLGAPAGPSEEGTPGPESGAPEPPG